MDPESFVAHCNGTVLRVPTPFVEDGRAVSLVVLLYKPAGVGPFPTLVFNHGSSDGIGGLEHALEDLDIVVPALRRAPDVDPDRMLIGGHSRGGLLSIVHAGTRPGLYRGALKFSGGWVGDHALSLWPGAINTVAFRRAAAFRLPTLWLYAERDSYYATDHPRENFDAFIEAGGEGEFRMYDLEADVDGHYLVDRRGAWSEAVDAFLRDWAQRPDTQAGGVEGAG